MIAGDHRRIIADEPVVVRCDEIMIGIIEFDERVAQCIGDAECRKRKGDRSDNELRRL